jgi:hypothetical protein
MIAGDVHFEGAGNSFEAAELPERALDADDENAPAPMSPAERRWVAERKSLAEVFGPLQGLDPMSAAINPLAERPIFRSFMILG